MNATRGGKKEGKLVTSAAGNTEKGSADWGCHENFMKPWK